MKRDRSGKNICRKRNIEEATKNVAEVAVYRSILQCITAYRSILQYIEVLWNISHYIAVNCRLFQFIAVYRLFLRS